MLVKVTLDDQYITAQGRAFENCIQNVVRL